MAARTLIGLYSLMSSIYHLFTGIWFDALSYELTFWIFWMHMKVDMSGYCMTPSTWKYSNKWAHNGRKNLVSLMSSLYHLNICTRDLVFYIKTFRSFLIHMKVDMSGYCMTRSTWKYSNKWAHNGRKNFDMGWADSTVVVHWERNQKCSALATGMSV